MTDYPASTVNELLAQTAANAPAIGAPGRPWMTHEGLRTQMRQTVDALNAIGIGRNDRVAIVLPNGPEMASAFVSIAAGATTAPLNSAYRTEEFAFYLGDLNAKALVIGEGMESPARAVAEAMNIPIVELIAGDGAAGTFTLRAPDSMRGAPSRTGLAEADDVALVLHTSGTTSRPKIVPLRHVNITASATHIRNTLHLTPDDVCLNIMPLFHIHGLIAATLSSLGAGASVFCSSGFNAFRFFTWFQEANPTWWTAVPTMHQTILGLAGRHEETIRKGRLRFIRSSSSSLPPQVMEEMERVFGVPVIELVRHDRGRASDDLQPAAARKALPRLGRHRRRSRRSHHG